MAISKRNRRGVFGLVLFCLIVAVAPRLISSAYSIEKPTISFEEAKKIHLEIAIKKSRSSKVQIGPKKKRFRIPSAKFDPKAYGLEDWMKLGLSKKQSEVVVKFASRGIENEAELERIFVIPNELFMLIKDSAIYSRRQSSNNFEIKRSEKSIGIIDINRCNQNDLENLPGIGQYFAGKIIEYRDNLGGFNSTSQLLEIWNFDNEKYDKISPYLTRSNEITKININSASLEELKSHPYISYAIANSIVKMRDQKNYISVTDIKRSKLIDEELFKKIEPYLECK